MNGAENLRGRPIGEQVDGMSFQDLEDRIRSELETAEMPGDSWLHVVALYDDRVVYRIDGGPYWQRSYSVDADGNVEIGSDRTEVNKLTVFEPVEESAPLREGATPSARTEDLIESFDPGFALREATVDRRQNVIQNVALLGRVSRNGRIYSDQSMREAVDLYAGVKFFIDHPPDSELRDRKGARSVHDLAGRVLNARKVGEQVRGDLELLDREPTKSLVFALAEQMPEVVGNSHRAQGEVRINEEGNQVVEHISRVYAVELVTDPATTNGLMEQFERDAGGEGDGGLTFKEEGEEMKDLSGLTVEEIKSTRPDLVRELISEQEQQEQFEALNEEVKDLRPKAERAGELGEQVETLTAERDELKEKVDAFEEEQRVRERKDLIRGKLEEAGLGKDEVPEPLFKQLMLAESEADVDALVESIRTISGNARRGSGGARVYERDPDAALSEGAAGNGSGRGRKPRISGAVLEEAYQDLFT